MRRKRRTTQRDSRIEEDKREWEKETWIYNLGE